eukprot:3035534-Amphidinium_carterae.1
MGVEYLARSGANRRGHKSVEGLPKRPAEPPFGSMVSGFGTKLSDLDVVLLEKIEDPHADKRIAQVKVLETLEQAIAQHPKWTVKASVPNARIPILTVAWTDGKKLVQEVDISVNNRAPLQNT